MDNLKNGLLTVGRSLLAVLLCVLTALTLLCTALQPFFTRTAYETVAQSDTVVSAMHADLLEQLESECLFYDLPYDTMKTVLSVDVVKTALTERANNLYDDLIGTETAAVRLDAAPFKAAIDVFFGTLPVEQRPIDPDASQTIASELADTLSLTLGMGIGNTLAKTVRPLFVRAQRFVHIGLWLWVAVLLFAMFSLLPIKSTLRQRAYGTASSLFIGSALIAVPSWLFKGLDFPKQLALGDSALRAFVCEILYTAIDRLNVIVTTAFVISALLLIGTVVWLVTDKKEKTA